VSRADELRKRADRLLAMAVEANARGDAALANHLTFRAMQYLEDAEDAPTSSDHPSPGPMMRGSEQMHRQPQQQQQTRWMDD
jgi:hypothetical protein